MTTSQWRFVALCLLALILVIGVRHQPALLWSWHEYNNLLDVHISGRNEAKILLEKAKMQLEKDNKKEALSLAWQVLEVDPNMRSAHWFALRFARKNNEQFRHLSALEKLDPLNAKVYLMQARLLRKQSKSQQAENKIMHGIRVIEHWLSLYKPKQDHRFGNRYNKKIIKDYRYANKEKIKLYKALQSKSKAG